MTAGLAVALLLMLAGVIAFTVGVLLTLAKNGRRLDALEQTIGRLWSNVGTLIEDVCALHAEAGPKKPRTKAPRGKRHEKRETPENPCRRSPRGRRCMLQAGHDGPCAHRCRRPPAGWRCTRDAGHDGPCAAVRNDGTR